MEGKNRRHASSFPVGLSICPTAAQRMKMLHGIFEKALNFLNESKRTLSRLVWRRFRYSDVAPLRKFVLAHPPKRMGTLIRARACSGGLLGLERKGGVVRGDPQGI